MRTGLLKVLHRADTVITVSLCHNDVTGKICSSLFSLHLSSVQNLAPEDGKIQSGFRLSLSATTGCYQARRLWGLGRQFCNQD